MVYRDILPNGIRVLTEPLNHLHSVATGIWTGVGSAHESDDLAGISHFLEHMMFKGTATRNAKQIAEVMESVGGQMNAFTSKEHTCYYTKCLDEHFALSLELLADIYLHSLFDRVEFEREKNVILEEINMYEDTPDDVANELFMDTLWSGHTYGRPIIGSKKSVSNIKRDDLYKYYLKNYRPQSTVITVAGNVTREQVLAEVEKYFAGFKGQKEEKFIADLTTNSGQAYVYKDIEQMHLCVGVPGLREQDKDYYAANVLCAALGSGASSRLFQEAREKRGLAYSIYAYHGSYSLGGYMMAYASTSPKNLDQMLSVIMEQIADIKERGLHEEELQRTKQQLKGGMLLSLENTSNVMSRIGRMELSWGRVRTIEETLNQLMNVTMEDINRVAQRLFVADKFVLSLVGPQESTFSFNKYI